MDIRTLWRQAQAVCFDVDSTVTRDEAIDVLATFCGKGAEIAAMTKRAMEGSIRFEDALRERLSLLRPSRDTVAACVRTHPPRLSPGIRELVARLRERQIHVYLISGGFIEMITPVAELLGIPADRIVANRFHFHADGSFAGYDTDAPTSRSGGKALAIARLKQHFGYAPLIMVGDGATDLEARPPADGFIGYGGVVVRQKVKAEADWFVNSFSDLTAALE
jgi:phosphoserine phosphatase